MDNANRRLHTGESKRSIAEDFGVAWINPEKEFEDSDSTDFSRSLQGYIYQCGTERVSWLLQRFRRPILWSNY